MATCPSCGAENRPDGRFCFRCGVSLLATCAACDTQLRPGARFCDECGTPVGAIAPVAAPGPTAPAPSGVIAERRLVSVLFADLVGFTPLSEHRDPEDVRELLSSYFETCRSLIERYGGVVEKFIGDAVMAVWGAPTANEDDAERAVRAALELVDAVDALGSEAGAPDLAVRAGVLTGEAAVTLESRGEGMVAGDLVNTASRIQAVAGPGTVLVGDATRRASEAAIAFDDAGEHELKGKAEPARLWRAMRVVAMRGGALRSSGLEAPFVGREAELRTVKDLFHASAAGRRAHMLAITGIAGIGKSRLSWEFYKYVDGLLGLAWWHRGRCVAYGDGVTYWALAEMVRGRAGIAEAEEAASARAKLSETVARFVTDPDEAAWVETRLAHLLALEERTAPQPEDLFGAWRLFFERMAESDPVILVFEDVQWADPSLLDFVDYLLNWSRNHPLFVLALARPEVADRFPGWSAGRRGVSTMYLEPLGRDDMERLLDGLAPGLPDAVRIEVLDRAEGVPLYAVETVRMLLDRGLLAREGSVYRPTGPIDDLAVPETLHALIAARLDGLPHDERTALQDAAVVGKTFSVAALAAVGDRDEPSVQANVDALVRKEVLAIQADPRSPERGQYVFLQDLVRRVAYDTLSRRDRKARHLAVAAFIEAGWTGEEAEIAEVLASHYLDAHRALPDDPDAPEIKAAARDALVRAATRSESLAARVEALGYFEQAIELTDEPSLRAELFGRAGRMAFAAARIERGRELFDAAAALDRELGDDVALARIEIERAYMATADGRIEEGRDGLIRALATLSDREADADVARAAAELGRMSYFLGRIDEALESIERALPIAEALFIPDVLAEALNTKAIIMASRGRRQEAEALLRHALALALEHDAAAAALRAYNNLVSTLGWRMPLEEQLDMFRRGAELARRIGHAGWQAKFLSDSVPTFVAAGRWDEAIAADDEARAAPDTASMAAAVMERTALVEVYAARSEFERAEAALSADVLEASEDVQAVRVLALARAWIAFHQERYEDAIALARPEGMQDPGLAGVATLGERGMVLATDAALALADLDRAREMVARTEASVPGPGSPYLDAHLARLRGRLAASDRDDEAARTAFDAAVAGLRGLGLRYDLAIALAQRGTWLADAGHADEADVALTEARRIFEDLRATWWLERLPSRRPDAMPAGRLDPISAEA